MRAPFLIEIPRGHIAFKIGTSPLYFLHPKNGLHASYSRRFLYIRMSDIENALPYYQKGLYGRGEEKLCDEFREVSVCNIVIFPIPIPKFNNLVT